MSNPFETLTPEQLQRFDTFVDSLPVPTDNETFTHYKKSLERLKLEDPELYNLILQMRNSSAKVVKEKCSW